jgi:hypothetical protein
LGLVRHVEHTKTTLGPCWVNAIHNIQPIDHTCYDNGGLTWGSCPTHYNSMMGLLGQCKWTCEYAKRMLGHVGPLFFAIMWKQLCHKNGKSSCSKGAFKLGVNDSSIKSSNTKLVI